MAVMVADCSIWAACFPVHTLSGLPQGTLQQLPLHPCPVPEPVTAERDGTRSLAQTNR